MQSYNFSNNSNLVAAERTATSLLISYFSSVHCFISMPTFRVTPDRVVVQLFYYAPTNFVGTGKNGDTTKLTSGGPALNALGSALSRLFSTTTSLVNVPVELRITRLHQPYLNSYILAQYLAVNASKYGFARLRQSLLSSVCNNIQNAAAMPSDHGEPSAILGVKVQLSGLLTTQRNAPRKTVSTVSVGTFHGKNLNTSVEYASSTSKSNLGAYTVKV